MGVVTERLADLARRCGDLSPIANDVRKVIERDNREAILAGQDGDGKPVAALKPSTLGHRKGTGPARAPSGANSPLIKGLVVSVQAGTGRLAFSKSWPSAPYWVYFASGTKNMARRDPSGVRPQARDEIRGMLAQYLKRGR